jgi:polygalacturonase
MQKSSNVMLERDIMSSAARWKEGGMSERVHISGSRQTLMSVRTDDAKPAAAGELRYAAAAAAAAAAEWAGGACRGA